MENLIKCGIITGFLSKTKDRFHEYNEAKSLEEKMIMVSKMKGLDGVEVVYPYEVSDPELLKSLISKYSINIAAINVNVKGEPEFRNGGLTSVDKQIRDKAISFIKGAKEFANAVGANKVTCCPLGDGYEFNFHCDYSKSWKYLVEAFASVSEYLPEIPLFIEYKPSETRGKCFIDTAAKTLFLLNDIGSKSLGVTLDFGHSIYGGENPAEVVCMLAESGYPYYIHINDNDGRWDWDYMVGTKHYLDYVEFLYYLYKYDYKDYLTSDTSPTRWDITGVFEMNARMTNKIWKVISGLDREQFNKLIENRDYLETWKFIEKKILFL